MIARLLSPLTAMILALLLAAAVGPGMYYFHAQAMIGSIVAAHRTRAAATAAAHAAQKVQGWDFWTVEMESLAGDLKEEKARLQQKQDALDRQNARLAAERQELDRVRADLTRMQKDLDSRVIAVHTDEVKNLRSLAQTYATLKPEAAVAILKELDDATAVKILSLMKPDVTGPIFETMTATPDGSGGTLARRAAQLSDKIRLMKSGVVAGP